LDAGARGRARGRARRRLSLVRGSGPSPTGEARSAAPGRLACEDRCMRAPVLDAPRSTPVVRDVTAPVPPEGGVVVRVEATGLCRSDWHAWAGHDDIAFPHVPGHELAGVVSAVGDGVQRWHVGDRVTVP